ncbi:hypothetical protein [Heliorestis convoluta]|uniref:Type III restriction enzyme, res subunit n=1 Tax=Heliorestis convoluta TaxID=356322 RepID=A0A5Q2MZD5_9FIRM|nr:hypothetical protein [Heliorestis convoluta]QGG46803.1 Type III restriction enzyme, res subunit [Heliorestis convoluta]
MKEEKKTKEKGEKRQSENNSNNKSLRKGSSSSEDLFMEIFADTFGLEKVQYLMPEQPFEDIYGYPRRIDYALSIGYEKYALEIDGQRYHDPLQVAKDKFIDDLIRQNSLIYQGWKVYRWAYRQLTQSPEQVKSELVQFLGNNPHLQIWPIFCPNNEHRRSLQAI